MIWVQCYALVSCTLLLVRIIFNPVSVDIGNSDSVGPVLGSCKLRYIDSSDNTNPVPNNSDDIGQVLCPCKLHSIVIVRIMLSQCQLT